ncbi:MAG TPA: hypothetical protein VG753_00280 [Candidatus Paceibacterota bacterium]|nr:hypothetical protein [Candidatus Paceibacterota bacterium]
MDQKKTDPSELIDAVQRLVEPLGCSVTGLGPDAVAVMGDARFYGPSVFVRFPKDCSMDEVSRISTRITNEVKGIARVMMEIDVV